MTRGPLMPLSLSAVTFACVVLASSGARAFCRTTTQPAPAGYNPASIGACWVGDGGPVVDLAWPVGSRIAFSLDASASKQVALSDATRIADQAFAAWNGTPCPGGGLGVQVYDNGPVSADVAENDCGIVSCPNTVHDPLHVIVFRDDGWPYNDPVQTLALTTVTFGVNSGTIYDADIEINSSDPVDHPLTTLEPPPAGSYDLQTILTHEAGHFLGLAHATDPQAIMYAYYTPGSLHPQADDVAGICAVYPPVYPSGGACSVGMGRRDASRSFVAIVAVALGILFRRCQRSRSPFHLAAGMRPPQSQKSSSS